MEDQETHQKTHVQWESLDDRPLTKQQDGLVMGH